MSKILVSFIVVFIAFMVPQSVRAEYVLPYPSFMPGHKLYRVSRVIDDVKRYWYWGNLASYRYYLNQSDKTLVEAKVLFEYGQYLLAIDALKRSNEAMLRIPDVLTKAKQEGKSTKRYEGELVEAKNKHRDILTKLASELPDEFIWQPERRTPTKLNIADELDAAIRLLQ